MDRTTALAFLTTEMAELATDANFSSQQLTTAYNTAIDMSLRYLAYQETDLPTANVDQGNIMKYLALLEYFALKRFLRLLTLRFDVALPAPVKVTRSQVFGHIERLLRVCELDLARMGIEVGAVASFQMGRVELDFLEPDYPFGLPFPFLGGDF